MFLSQSSVYHHQHLDDKPYLKGNHNSFDYSYFELIHSEKYKEPIDDKEFLIYLDDCRTQLYLCRHASFLMGKGQIEPPNFYVPKLQSSIF